jgi:glycosyltransferase involved in cell wall biosynthesis
MSLVSIVLPTFNRARFLPEAFECIQAQTWKDWELIVVDDGSTDDTPRVIDTLQRSKGSIRYIRQSNRGPGAARNRGAEASIGEYLAFFDSDDLWLPKHLERCVRALDAHPEVDWVFCACRKIDMATRQTMEWSTFHDRGRPRPFTNLQVLSDGDLKIIIDDAALECQIRHGLYCGFQSSVIRRRMFDAQRIEENVRVGEDQLYVMRALMRGARLAYFQEPLVVYRVHNDHTSAADRPMSSAKHVEVHRTLAENLERLLTESSLTARERRALRKRVATEYFWHVGYLGHWQAGQRTQAVDMFRRGLAWWPWDAAAIKTYLLARLRLAVQRTK